MKRKYLIYLLVCFVLILLGYLFYNQKNKTSYTPIQLNNSYSYSDSTLYRQGNKLSVVDIEDIQVFTYSEKTEKVVLLYMPDFIKNNFRFSSIRTGWLDNISNNYIIADKKVYFLDSEIKGADIESFVPIYNEYSVDKDNIYCIDKKLDISKDEFSFVEGSFDYVTDGKKLFSICKLLTGVDIATFKLEAGLSGEIGFAYDKNHKYFRGKIYTGYNPGGLTEVKEEPIID